MQSIITATTTTITTTRSTTGTIARCGRTTGAVLALAALTAGAGSAQADDLFVPSPEYPTLQAALGAAADGDVIVIRAGTLTGPGNRDLTMPPVRLTFRGETGDPADVVWEGSGDPLIDGRRAITIASPASSGTRFEDLTIRSFTSQGGGAMRISGVDLAFDNCVIANNSGGALDCFEGERGGAISIGGGSILFIDCVISGNTTNSVICVGVGASTAGGAIDASGADLRFERCDIVGNASVPGDGSSMGTGGAIASNATVELIDTVVRGNQAWGGRGGAISASRVLAIDSTFENNRVLSLDGTAIGGAIAASRATIIGGSFMANRAGEPGDTFRGRGGAIHVNNLTMANVVLTGNRAAGYGGVEGGAVRANSASLDGVTMRANSTASDALRSGEAIHSDGGTLAVRNSIVENGPDWLGGGSTAMVTWSCIVGGFPGEGNIDAAPMLDGDFKPLPGSPVIDAGNTALLPADVFDLDGDGDTSEPVPFDAAGLARVVDEPATPDTGVGSPVVDMGAFEVQRTCRADLDGDGELTLLDFLAFQNLFGAGDPTADFDGDGEFTIFDFLAFQNEFDAGCP